jgi:hypothetical protein
MNAYGLFCVPMYANDSKPSGPLPIPDPGSPPTLPTQSQAEEIVKLKTRNKPSKPKNSGSSDTIQKD